MSMICSYKAQNGITPYWVHLECSVLQTNFNSPFFYFNSWEKEYLTEQATFRIHTLLSKMPQRTDWHIKIRNPVHFYTHTHTHTHRILMNNG